MNWPVNNMSSARLLPTLRPTGTEGVPQKSPLVMPEVANVASGITNGLFCGTPSVPVGLNVGSKRALDMLFTGQFIDAQAALRDGLVSRVVPADRLDQETMALANAIAAQPPQQIASGKAMFYKHMEMKLADAYALATDFMTDALQT